MLLRSYTGTDMQSHSQEYEDIPNGLVSVDLSEGAQFQGQSFDGISIRAIKPGTFSDFHNPPRRLMMITLSGEAEIGYGDGTTRRLKAGDVHVEDDTTGQGHTFKVMGDVPRVTLIIPLK
jgi:quercetin dioxygenase-like cupin family protein